MLPLKSFNSLLAAWFENVHRWELSRKFLPQLVDVALLDGRAALFPVAIPSGNLEKRQKWPEGMAHVHGDQKTT